MPTYSILVLNGPNLAALGRRQPDIYGHSGLDAIPGMVERLMGAQASQADLDFFQSNHEGLLIDRLERAEREKTDGIVLNAGAFTHTSLALADCLAWIGLPFVEVHVSNILGREDEPLRRRSLLARHSIGVITGFGILSYALAVQALVAHLNNRR